MPGRNPQPWVFRWLSGGESSPGKCRADEIGGLNAQARRFPLRKGPFGSGTMILNARRDALFGGWHAAGYAALKAVLLLATAAVAFRFTQRRQSPNSPLSIG